MSLDMSLPADYLPFYKSVCQGDRDLRQHQCLWKAATLHWLWKFDSVMISLEQWHKLWLSSPSLLSNSNPQGSTDLANTLISPTRICKDKFWCLQRMPIADTSWGSVLDLGESMPIWFPTQLHRLETTNYLKRSRVASDRHLASATFHASEIYTAEIWQTGTKTDPRSSVWPDNMFLLTYRRSNVRQASLLSNHCFTWTVTLLSFRPVCFDSGSANPAHLTGSTCHVGCQVSLAKVS